jgi:hypothetical protein
MVNTLGALGFAWLNFCQIWTYVNVHKCICPVLCVLSGDEEITFLAHYVECGRHQCGGRLLETASNPSWVSGWFLSGSQKIQRHNSDI